MDQPKGKKVLYILYIYPQLSETYIMVEINALIKAGYEVKVISLKAADKPTESPVEYTVTNDMTQIMAIAKGFNPDVIHTHWIDRQLRVVYKVAKALNIPYTIRSHSFDVLWRASKLIQRLRWMGRNMVFRPIINDPLCRGVLAFPFAKEHLVRTGFKAEKIVTAYPVIDYERFYDRSPNGEKIINLGACLPKKNFESYIRFAKTMPELTFDLYAIGYQKEYMKGFNRQEGNPVVMPDEVPHSKMKEVYKEHRWLIYTFHPQIAQVGWPLVAAEAMAAGVGVCLPNIRPDMKEYIEDGGIIYSSLEELREILSKPVPEKMRERGFEVAKKCDIAVQLPVLTALWE